MTDTFRLLAICLITLLVAGCDPEDPPEKQACAGQPQDPCCDPMTKDCNTGAECRSSGGMSGTCVYSGPGNCRCDTSLGGGGQIEIPETELSAFSSGSENVDFVVSAPKFMPLALPGSVAFCGDYRSPIAVPLSGQLKVSATKVKANYRLELDTDNLTAGRLNLPCLGKIPGTKLEPTTLAGTYDPTTGAVSLTSNGNVILESVSKKPLFQYSSTLAGTLDPKSGLVHLKVTSGAYKGLSAAVEKLR